MLRGKVAYRPAWPASPNRWPPPRWVCSVCCSRRGCGRPAALLAVVCSASPGPARRSRRCRLCAAAGPRRAADPGHRHLRRHALARFVRDEWRARLLRAQLRAAPGARGGAAHRRRSRGAAAAGRDARDHRAVHRHRGLHRHDRACRTRRSGRTARRLFRRRDAHRHRPWRHDRQDRRRRDPCDLQCAVRRWTTIPGVPSPARWRCWTASEEVRRSPLGQRLRLGPHAHRHRDRSGDRRRRRRQPQARLHRARQCDERGGAAGGGEQGTRLQHLHRPGHRGPARSGDAAPDRHPHAARPEPADRCVHAGIAALS